MSPAPEALMPLWREEMRTNKREKFSLPESIRCLSSFQINKSPESPRPALTAALTLQETCFSASRWREECQQPAKSGSDGSLRPSPPNAPSAERPAGRLPLLIAALRGRERREKRRGSPPKAERGLPSHLASLPIAICNSGNSLSLTCAKEETEAQRAPVPRRATPAAGVCLDELAQLSARRGERAIP